MYKRRQKIDADIERDIITAMITSPQYLMEVADKIDVEYFKQPYIKIVASWVVDYFENYKDAPGKAVESIYNVEKSSLDDTNASLVWNLLLSLSEKYINEDDGKQNIQYLVDRTVDYCKERSLEILADGIRDLVHAGRQKDAEKLLDGYKKVAKPLSKWIDPFDDEYIKHVYKNYFVDRDERGDSYLFKFPGQLGELMGAFHRDWLVGWEAPYKRGKTMFLMMCAIYALMESCKVVFISLEMRNEEVAMRKYKITTGVTEKANTMLVPIWDCLRNQKNTCTKNERVNDKKLLDAEGEKPIFSKSLKYTACTVCRGLKTNDYKLGTWWEPITRKAVSLNDLMVKVGAFKSSYGSNLRLKSYPAKTANLSQVISDIDNLEYTEGFIPDVIIIDYATILAPEDSRMETRHRIDETWSSLKGLSQVKHCCVITASQTNKKTLKAKLTEAGDVSEESRILGHVDAMYGLNQLATEKNEGIIRVNCTMHRHRAFDESRTVTVLQQLDIGQVVLDSAWT